MSKHSIGYIKDNDSIEEIFVELQSNGSVNFYDKNNNLLSVFIRPDSLIASREYRDRPPEFLTQLNSLWQNILENSISLQALNKERELYLEQLGLEDSSLISSTSSINLDQEIDESKLSLTDKKKSDTPISQSQIEKNEKALKVAGIREETKLNTLVDDRYTLGELLGINDPHGSLVCVNSTSIYGNQSRSTFTFLIKHSDGSLEKADMLLQQDGLNPSREVYSSNRDGSSVDRVNVRSMYRFSSPSAKNCMLAISYGELGNLKFHYGIFDNTDNNRCISIPLETNTTRYVTKEVQDSLDPEHGLYRSSESLDEIDHHLEHGCDDLTIKEADGIKETGHHHFEDNDLTNIAEQIINKNPELEAFYSTNGLANLLKSYVERHSDEPFGKIIDDFTEETIADCQHFKSI